MSAGRKRSHTGSAVPTAGAVPTSVLFSRPAMGPSSASPPASEGTRTGRAISTSSAARWAPIAGGSASLSKAPIEPEERERERERDRAPTNEREREGERERERE